MKVRSPIDGFYFFKDFVLFRLNMRNAIGEEMSSALNALSDFAHDKM